MYAKVISACFHIPLSIKLSKSHQAQKNKQMLLLTTLLLHFLLPPALVPVLLKSITSSLDSLWSKDHEHYKYILTLYLTWLHMIIYAFLNQTTDHCDWVQNWALRSWISAKPDWSDFCWAFPTDHSHWRFSMASNTFEIKLELQHTTVAHKNTNT